jgi:hypothetical protein
VPGTGVRTGARVCRKCDFCDGPGTAALRWLCLIGARNLRSDGGMPPGCIEGTSLHRPGGMPWPGGFAVLQGCDQPCLITPCDQPCLINPVRSTASRRRDLNGFSRPGDQPSPVSSPCRPTPVGSAAERPREAGVELVAPLALRVRVAVVAHRQAERAQFAGEVEGLPRLEPVAVERAGGEEEAYAVGA